VFRRSFAGGFVEGVAGGGAGGLVTGPFVAWVAVGAGAGFDTTGSADVLGLAVGFSDAVGAAGALVTGAGDDGGGSTAPWGSLEVLGGPAVVEALNSGVGAAVGMAGSGAGRVRLHMRAPPIPIASTPAPARSGTVRDLLAGG
jgi:hypothetical protein